MDSDRIEESLSRIHSPLFLYFPTSGEIEDFALRCPLIQEEGVEATGNRFQDVPYGFRGAG
jgi:hypothetical protein